MACIKLRTKQAVEECIITYQKYSLCKFVHYNSSKTFADTEWKPSSTGHVYWEWNKADVQTALIPFDSVPFMFIGHKHMACHQGIDLAKKRKADCAALKQSLLEQGNVFLHDKTRTQCSKKVGCPAVMRITRIAKFPQYKLTNRVSLGKKREYCKALKRKLMKNPSSVYWEEVYFVCIPSYKEHSGHPVASQQQSSNANMVMDDRVKQQIIELTRQGVKNVGEMREHINDYIHTSMFSKCDVEDPPTKHCYFHPTDIDIRNLMQKTKEDMYKYAFEESHSSDDEIVEVHIPDSFMDDDVEHKVVTERDGLKKRCLDQLKAMINLVEKIGDDEDLEKLAYQLGDIRAGTHPKSPENMRSYSSDDFFNYLESYITMEALQTNTKPIKVIIESEPVVNHSIPTSVVEIAMHDHEMFVDK